MLEFVRGLARGELPAAPDGTHGVVRAYLALPAKPEGEPMFALPALTSELPLGLPPSEPVGDEVEPEETEEASDVEKEDPAQMTLL